MVGGKDVATATIMTLRDYGYKTSDLAAMRKAYVGLGEEERKPRLEQARVKTVRPATASLIWPGEASLPIRSMISSKQVSQPALERSRSSANASHPPLCRAKKSASLHMGNHNLR